MKKEYAYHFTYRGNVEGILRDGLRMSPADRQYSDGLSGFYKKTYRKFYLGKWPIFLAKPDCDVSYLFRGNYEILTVDVTGLKKYPDLPTFDSEFQTKWWDSEDDKNKEATESDLLFRQVRLKEITIREAGKLIDVTKTFAVLSHISASRISL